MSIIMQYTFYLIQTLPLFLPAFILAALVNKKVLSLPCLPFPSNLQHPHAAKSSSYSPIHFIHPSRAHLCIAQIT